MQVFQMAEFDFCYNYVFFAPFQKKSQFIISSAFTFDDIGSRQNCSRTDNVLFREVNQSSFSITIDGEFDLNQQPFSLFFYVWTNLTISDAQISMKLSNSSNADFAFLVATVPEFSVRIIDSTFTFTSNDAISSFFGLANNFTELVTVNRSTFAYSCMTAIQRFYGLAGQAYSFVVQNSSFSVKTGAATSCGFVSLVLGQSTFKNVSVSGALSGANTFGFIFENRGACSISNVTYSLVTSGATANCGFVQQNTGSGFVSTSQITFVGFSNIPLISEPASYTTGVCPCITGSVLQSGLCYCASGSLPNAGFTNCSCQTANAFIQNQVCICGVNATNTSNSCTCPPDSILIDGECKCITTDAFLVNGACSCGTNATNSSNVCTCPTGSILVNGICSCSTTNAFPVNGVCSCGTNATNSSNVCTCPTGSTLVSGVCKCTTTNAFPVSGVCVCGTNATNTSNSCNCPTGSTLINGICKCSTTNAFPNTAKSACICATDASNSSNTCTCPTNSIQVGTACICQPTYSVMVSSVCTCSQTLMKGSKMVGSTCACPTGATFGSATCVCNMKGSTLSGTNCACNTDYTGWFYLNGGNYWCTDSKLCCSYAIGSMGLNQYSCSDGNWHGCTYNSNSNVVS
ncbi:Conserved_hypothetical protein [Hexamita inflata]|uniref:Uncharacterized protein n=1 Tax=Hexamita inflata TaxID=28002 RepID=A0ABP1GL32_9EUKA